MVDLYNEPILSDESISDFNYYNNRGWYPIIKPITVKHARKALTLLPPFLSAPYIELTKHELISFKWIFRLYCLRYNETIVKYLDFGPDDMIVGKEIQPNGKLKLYGFERNLNNFQPYIMNLFGDRCWCCWFTRTTRVLLRHDIV